MLYDYILNNYQKDEPIFLQELPGNSRESLRQEMKKLTDEGKLIRLYNGVYYLAYTTILGTQGRMSVKKYIDKKYLNTNGTTNGYMTGLQVANEYGFTTQNPAIYEVCSNEASTKQRKLNIDGKQLVVYKPVATITAQNKSALQFLDLISNIDKYSELKGTELKEALQRFVKYINVNFEEVKKYLPLYPDRTYRNLYEGGLMHELV